MKNGSINDFIDGLYYGQEMVFVFRGKKYFIQGWWAEGREEATLVLTELVQEPFQSYLWEHHAARMSECAECFLRAPIWEGKCFTDVQEEVIWADW